jgi:hypothetical protein
MEFIQLLKDKYGTNNPILIDEIKDIFKKYSRPRISQFIDEAITKKMLARYDMGIYYLPTETMLGMSLPHSRKVVEKVYLENGDEIYGFYTGLSLMNYIGLTTQVPYILEIVSNNTKARTRRVKVRKQTIILRKARTKITRENYLTLMILELVTQMDMDDILKKDFIKYIKSIKITRKEIQKYIKFFPKETAVKLIESGVIYEFARG